VVSEELVEQGDCGGVRLGSVSDERFGFDFELGGGADLGEKVDVGERAGRLRGVRCEMEVAFACSVRSGTCGRIGGGGLKVGTCLGSLDGLISMTSVGGRVVGMGLGLLVYLRGGFG